MTTQATETGETVGSTATDWRSHAACTAVLEPEAIFFPIGEEPDIEAAAKAVCAQCPVTGPCLVYAIQTHQGHGIWGGLTPPERDEFALSERRASQRRASQPPPIRTISESAAPTTFGSGGP